MRTTGVAALLLAFGWLLGWYTHEYMRHETAVPAVTVPAAPFTNPLPGAGVPDDIPAPADVMQQLLSSGDYESAVEYYEAMQRQADEPLVQRLRLQMITHVRELLEWQRYTAAGSLLQRLLVSAWRDVDVRILLAELDYRQGDTDAAIAQLYEARGHAWDQDTLARLLPRIRGLVNERAAALREQGDQAGLLEFYQRLTQLEPDHAPYFIGLAGAQLALGDTGAALQSLQLVAQDPDYGAQAGTMIAKLQTVPEYQDRETVTAPAFEVAGIPLQRRGSHFLVEARPGRGDSLNLLIDTGASMTIITPAALDQRGVRYTDTGRTGIFNTANGRVSAPIYRIDRLAVDGWEVRTLDVGVLDLGNRRDIDGLLGMNFLRYFQFFIDQSSSRLRLSLREQDVAEPGDHDERY